MCNKSQVTTVTHKTRFTHTLTQHGDRGEGAIVLGTASDAPCQVVRCCRAFVPSLGWGHLGRRRLRLDASLEWAPLAGAAESVQLSCP